MSERQVVLALDIGSSSVRASLYDTNGECVSSGIRQDHRFVYSPDGAATMSPEDLLRTVSDAIDRVLESSRAQIIGVAMSTFWHSLICLDADNRPTTPILTWADRRSRSSIASLPTSLYEITGCPPHSSYWPAKILWMKKTLPEEYSSTSRLASPGDYLYLNLFGRFSTGTSMSSGTGMRDLDRSEWSDEVLEAVGVSEDMLPEVSDEPFFGLLPEWAERWPELSEVPWYPAVGDGACSNVGSGCTDRENIALMVGTSGAMRIAWSGLPRVGNGLWCYRIDGGRFVSGGALSDGGSLVKWVGENFRVGDDVEGAVAAISPDSHGLTFLPLLSGERGPGWSDAANGAISGLSMSTSPEEVMRAAMESVAFRFAGIRERMSGLCDDDAAVVASGGGLVNSPTWAKIMADVLGVPVGVSSESEASSRGAALLALEAMGRVDLSDECFEPEVSRIVEPDAANHEIYREAIERQQRLYEAVIKPPVQ